MNTDDGAYYSRLYRLWSVIAFGPSSAALRSLSEQFGNTESLYTALTEDDRTRNAMPSDLIRAADRTTLSSAERLMDFCDKNRISIVTLDDEDYPVMLRNIYDPPSVLFYRGDISPLNDSLAVGMVGTRKPSDYSLRVTSEISSGLAKNGFSVVSGFAEGIDINSQLSCIKNGGRTYSVIASGLDHPYPKNNMQYYDLISSNGAIITEYPPSTQPFPRNFLMRNRILAGLSLCFAVIEAGSKSGSMNSAAHAVSQNKTVFVLPPHDVSDKRYFGNISLLKDGARMLTCAYDIISEYKPDAAHIIASDGEPMQYPDTSRHYPDMSQPEEKEIPEKKKDIPVFDDPVMNGIISELSSGITLRSDELSILLGKDIEDILTALTELEIEGLIISQNGNFRLI